MAVPGRHSRRTPENVHVCKLIGLNWVGVGFVLFFDGSGGEWFFARVCRLGSSTRSSTRLPADRAEGGKKRNDSFCAVL